MALSDEKIAEIGEACGLKCKIADANYLCDMFWFDTDPTQFARAIEAEVRKQDEALIRQLVAALEGYRRNHNDTQPCDAERAGRARLMEGGQ